MFGDIWVSMGLIRWPLGFASVVTVVLALWSAGQLFAGESARDLRTKAWIDAVLFWGGFAFVTGVLGTLLGIILAAESIERAGEASAPLVWGGIKVAMLSAAFGTFVLASSALAWFGLQLRWRLLAAEYRSDDL